ncbi:hypothetical protein [Pseudomonas entomophila]|uniref:Tc toxin subunit A-related protein n=1 Tax=Pseudomonas entomophila TaxID=312306 RepID=UPI001F013CB4|nr:hypothetical protein [Pseudomonas entomophila]MCG8293112.1 hypothetical protein [Pseudomonas entomophila]
MEAGLNTRLSVHQAITKAREQNRLDVVNLYFKREEDEIRKKTSSLPDGIDLDAALRLRHFHPDACRRILLHIDPAHKMVFEDELIADGIDRLTFRCPINLDIRRYKFELKLKDGNDDLGTLTHEYTLVDTTDDAVPSVQLRRNDEQALYLDMEEVNAKRVTDQKRLPDSLRLNTLFGKQLVALATQSVQRALSWEAQCLPEPRLEPGSYPSTVDFHSANGLYFWELFFHAPFLVAWLKRQNREYGEAWRSSTRHLFDPYRTWVPEGNHPPLYWLTQPLLGTPAFEATEKTSDPDELAYAAPERYKKALHLFVVENWQRQGDDLYRQLNLDTLVEAALCYDKALRLIGVLPENLSTTPAQAKSLAESTTADFTPPLNNKLVELRNLLRNRLFNLRHGLTLDGKPAAIMLDPETLDRIALGYGGTDQDRGKAGSVARTVPPCRYEEARKYAGEAVLQLIELGQTQLRLYERDASLQLSLASKANIIKLMDFPCRLQAQALELARRERETVLASKRMVEGRHSYYQGLVDEGITDLEHASRAMACVSQIFLHVSTLMALSANTVEASLPTIFGLSFGGQKPSKTIEVGAYTFKLVSEAADIAKHELRAQAEFELRSQQWQFEAEQASLELQILDKQLLEHDIRIKAASIAADEARATQAAHRAEYDIMTSVFANRPTNLWLIGRLSEIYASAYDATLSLCLMAEACLQYELGDFSSTWIKTDGWLDNWRGMLAGEALERDLMLMDVAAIRDNHRPLDIRKDLSLLACMKWTHEDLHAQLEGDEVLFTLSPWLFDQDYPGHYLRRIEKVSVSFKIDGTSSSDPMPAMLTQYSNKVLLTDDAEGAKHLYVADEGNADNLLRDLRPHQSTAIWSMKEVARNFDLQPSVPDKARYQPFEGTGLLSSWRLSFPGGAKNNPLLYRNGEWLLEDITLQISYSAVDGTPEFGAKVKDTLARFKASVATEDADYATRAAAAQASLGAKKDIRKALKKALDTLKSAEAKAKLSADTAQTIRAGTPKAQLDDKTSPAYQALKEAEDDAGEDKTKADKARIKVDALRQMEAKAATQALDAAKAKSLETVQKASEIILRARQAIETDGAADTFKTSEGMSRVGVVNEATAVLQTATQTVERILIAIPNEESASGAALKAQEATEAARKALKAAEAVAQARKAAEAEAKRIADEAAAKRIADEAAAKRIADEAAAKRIADEAAAKRIADEAAAKRKDEEAAALIKSAKDAEQQALDDLKTVQADADAAKAAAPKLEGPAYVAQSILKRAQKAADQATAARKNAETAITNKEMDKAATEVESAKQAANEVRTTVENVAAARLAAESDKDAVWASATALVGKPVKIYLWYTQEERIKVIDAEIKAVHEKYKSIDYYDDERQSLVTNHSLNITVKIEAS